MYDTYMSTPGKTAKLGATHSNIQTAQRGPSLVGSEPTMHKSATLPTMLARLSPSSTHKIVFIKY